eukprot:308419-Amorphochlora_amoeboformis.AAC.2
MRPSGDFNELYSHVFVRRVNVFVLRDVSFAVIVTGCLVATTCEVFVPPPPVRVSTTVIPEDIFNHTSPMLFKRNLHHFRWRHEVLPLP